VKRTALLALLAGCPDDECRPGWRAAVDDDGGSFLAVQGTGADDVWAVGGGLGVAGARALHWDGDGWRALELDGEARSLWWVWPEAPGVAWMVGEGGLALRVDGDTIEPVETGTDAHLWGVWGAAPDDVWMVGTDDTVLRWDGASVTPAGAPAREVSLLKVWGAAADDVWVSGGRGTMLHWDGAVWTDRSAELATVSSVPTVHGCASDEVYAVAGQALHRWDGDGWGLAPYQATSTLNGVSCGAAEVLVVGNGGLRARIDRATGEVADERLEGPWDADYHGAWLDDAGVAWAAGGNFNTPDPPVRRGVLAARGCPGPAPL
jgi:hypothetical protein